MNNAYVSENDLASTMCDLVDVMESLPSRVKKLPKDNDGGDTTIGDCLDSIKEFLDNLKKQFGNQGNLRW